MKISALLGFGLIGVSFAIPLRAADVAAVTRQLCSTADRAGDIWTLEMSRTPKQLRMMSLSAERKAGSNLQACEINATPGDGRSRFAETAKAAFVRIEGDDGVARITLSYADPKNGIAKNEMLLSVAGKSDAPAQCGIFTVPQTFLIVTSEKTCRLTVISR